jgi:hypothetical protein
MKGNYEICRSKELPTPGGTLLQQVFTVLLVHTAAESVWHKANITTATYQLGVSKIFPLFYELPFYFLFYTVVFFSIISSRLVSYSLFFAKFLFTNIVLHILLISISFRTFFILHRIFLLLHPSFYIYLFSLYIQYFLLSL